MVVATLTRGETTIDLPLLEGGGGSPIVSTDLGKPQQDFRTNGTLDPLSSDQRSQTRTHTLAVRFIEGDAYEKALDLADLIKSSSGGSETILEIPLPEFGDMLVAPSPENAVDISYQPGRRDWVDVALSLTEVDTVMGSTTQVAETPRASGNGPITISNGSETVELREDVTVERSISRPNSVIRGTTRQYPNYIDHAKSAQDTFEIACEFTSDAVYRAETLKNMVGEPLGRSTLTLNFNGIYNMGALDVVPTGSQALRLVRPSGQEGTIIAPNFNLQVSQ